MEAQRRRAGLTEPADLAERRFEAIADLDLGGFWLQNPVWDLTIARHAEEAGRLRVVLSANAGLSAGFACGRAAVAAVRPLDAMNPARRVEGS